MAGAAKSASIKDASARVMRFDLANMPGPLLRRAHQQSRNVYDQLMGSSGFTRQQISLMISIYQHPGLTHSQLSDISGFDRNTLAEMIDRLAAEGLARRNRSESDKRAYEICLTAQGRQAIDKHIAAVEQVQQRILDMIPADKRADFIACLKLVAGLTADDPA